MPLFNATVPLYVTAVVLLLVNAPTLETPVPFMVKASVASNVSEKLFISKLAPDVTDTPPALVPNGPDPDEEDDTPNFNVPELTVVKAVYVFAPDKITELVVAPVLTINKGFAAPLIIPETVKVPVVALPDVPI